MSRTSPTKLATPPIPRLPPVSLPISAPISKSSRWTRIIASASGHRRKQRDLVAGADRVARLDIFLIDRDADHREILERRGKSRTAALQPAQQPGHVGDPGGQLH